MPVTQGKDLMYGGRVNPPANSPNAAFISYPLATTFKISSQTGMLAGGNIQLYARQWTSGAGSTVFYQCWDGSNVWQWNKNGDYQWDLILTGQTYWPKPSSGVGGTTQWSIIPQTGTAGQPSSSVDMNFDCQITIAPPVGISTQVTFKNVNNGAGGTTNIVITVDIGGMTEIKPQ